MRGRRIRIVHQMPGECDTEAKCDTWISSIKKVSDLGPEMVVRRHKRASEMDGSYHVAATRVYIEIFGQLLGKAGNVRQLAGMTLERYPERFNEGALIVGCVNAFKALERQVVMCCNDVSKLEEVKANSIICCT